jgi:hypothetical protein
MAVVMVLLGTDKSVFGLWTQKIRPLSGNEQLPTNEIGFIRGEVD